MAHTAWEHAARELIPTGRGLIEGTPGSLCTFEIDMLKIDPAGLTVVLEGPGKTEITGFRNARGTIYISYVAHLPGRYKITVRFAGQHVVGSPFVVKIADQFDGERKATASKRPQTGVERYIKQSSGAGTAREVFVFVYGSNFYNLKNEYDIDDLESVITSPSGQRETSTLRYLPYGRLGVLFTARENGRYTVDVVVHKKTVAVQGFPIRVQIGKPGI